MPNFDSAGVTIHYEEQGSGAPVVLVHGFASSLKGNWGDPGWIGLLAQSYRTIAFDCRGHGLSGKPHEAGAYGEKMGEDVIRLMDHLKIGRALLMGYSMGGRISLGLLASHPERLRAVVLGGIGGGGSMADPRRPQGIVRALLADDPGAGKDEVEKLFRAFAEQNHNDLKALAACMGAPRGFPDARKLGAVKVPVLIVVGSKDVLVGDPEPLRKLIPGSAALILDGRDHLTAVDDKRYKEAVLRFFERAPA